MTSGDVLLCDLNPVAGREQGGVRPVVVVSHPRYAVVPGLFIAVPLSPLPISPLLSGTWIILFSSPYGISPTGNTPTGGARYNDRPSPAAQEHSPR